MPKILIVEDNADNSELIADVLTAQGYTVLKAEDGRVGVEAARREMPDLILMDISLPVMDGYAATREIRADHHLDGIPVIALTAHAMAGDEARALEAGCAGYVTKPIDVQTFAQKIAGFLKGCK